MYTAVRIQEKGQVTIPTNIRRKFSLKKGDLVTFVATDSGIVIKSLDQAADELLAGLQDKLDKRGISLNALMERSVQKGGDAAASELGLSAAEKESFMQAMFFRLQAAVTAIQDDAKRKGTDKLTEEEIEVEVQAARREMRNAHRP
ncbi:MAG: AbrB/MazE/SpoVT family DNA-binding domain-containing protein [Anaerolineales bacterium]|nr:AbrB/MazE/SpoVT family DNA-binding domain-containing protein [Anaerolineales bacterium]